MAEERLSRLQKHILFLLFDCWEGRAVTIKAIKDMCRTKGLDMKHIMESTDSAVIDVTLSRTLWNMQEKGLVMIYGTDSMAVAKKILAETEDEEMRKFIRYYMAKPLQEGRIHYPITKGLNKKASMVQIAEEGITTALMLRNKRKNLNNKEGGLNGRAESTGTESA